MKTFIIYFSIASLKSPLQSFTCIGVFCSCSVFCCVLCAAAWKNWCFWPLKATIQTCFFSHKRLPRGSLPLKSPNTTSQICLWCTEHSFGETVRCVALSDCTADWQMEQDRKWVALNLGAESFELINRAHHHCVQTCHSTRSASCKCTLETWFLHFSPSSVSWPNAQ